MPKYQNIRELLYSTLTVAQFEALPQTLGFNSNGPTWLGRRLSRPGTFKREEAERLAVLLQMPLAELLNDYGVAKETLTASEAEEILNGAIPVNTTAA